MDNHREAASGEALHEPLVCTSLMFSASPSGFVQRPLTKNPVLKIISTLSLRVLIFEKVFIKGNTP
jgi:hypothetical protein